ncbi:HEAT repeat domain-containing protein, partial [Fibrobacterota bacterium]
TRVIGTARLPSLYSYIGNLLSDKNLNVARAAINCAGNAGAVEFGRDLVNLLGKRQVSRLAREALAKMGDRIVDLLDQCLKDKNLDIYVRLGIPRVLSYIPTQKSIASLSANLKNADSAAYSEILRGLNRIKYSRPRLKFNRTFFGNQVRLSIRKFYDIQYVLHVLFSEAGTTQTELEHQRNSGRLLKKALKEKQDKLLRRTFRLLGLIYTPDDMINAYKGVTSNHSVLQANTLEYLDTLLEPGLKRYLLPILERETGNPILKKYEVLYKRKLSGRRQALLTLLHGDDNWLKACTLYYLTGQKTGMPEAESEALIRSRDHRVREAAQFFISRNSE